MRTYTVPIKIREVCGLVVSGLGQKFVQAQYVKVKEIPVAEYMYVTLIHRDICPYPVAYFMVTGGPF